MVSAGKAGFSLIEMLIVVLVIAVLAGIAVPSYQEWLARAENAAALADLGQMVRTETALFGDWQQFGRTNESASVAGHGGGASLIGPGTQDTVLACPSRPLKNYPGAGLFLPVAVFLIFDNLFFVGF